MVIKMNFNYYSLAGSSGWGKDSGNSGLQNHGKKLWNVKKPSSYYSKHLKESDGAQKDVHLGGHDVSIESGHHGGHGGEYIIDDHGKGEEHLIEAKGHEGVLHDGGGDTGGYELYGADLSSGIVGHYDYL